MVAAVERRMGERGRGKEEETGKKENKKENKKKRCFF